MKWLEIILLKTPCHCTQQASNYMREFYRIIKKHNLLEVNFYVQASIPGDI